jgi:DNA gyrase subunit A
VRPSGLIAISLDEDDQLGWACLTGGKDEIILITRNGQALRYPETEIRAMGRTAMGVIGIRTRPGDRLAAMEVVEPEGHLLVVTEKGFGKRTPLAEYSPKGRGTMGSPPSTNAPSAASVTSPKRVSSRRKTRSRSSPVTGL